jgi:phage gp46-like protein
MLDIALRFDPVARRFDVAVEGRDLVLDRTAATPMLLGLGCDRRARPDDALPGEAVFGARRGWPGDALDGAGRRLGSRLWLLERAKQTEAVRLRAESYALEGLARLADELGLDVTASAAWARPGVLALTARAASAEVTISRAVAA